MIPKTTVSGGRKALWPATCYQRLTDALNTRFLADLSKGRVSHDIVPAMIELEPVSESQVVLAFLKAEIESLDYSERILKLLKMIGATRQKLIDDPDLESDCCNALRRVVLDGYRGYIRRAGLFAGFPSEVAWQRVLLEPHDFNRLKYIANEEHWEAYSHGTRRPHVAVDSIARGEFPDLEKKIKGIQEKLKTGVLLPELIAVVGENGDLILVEGHCRATAYVGIQWSPNIPTFLGSSPLMHGWHFYKDRNPPAL